MHDHRTACDKLAAIGENPVGIASSSGQPGGEGGQLGFRADVERFDFVSLAGVVKRAPITREIYPIGAAGSGFWREAAQRFSARVELEHFFRPVGLPDIDVVCSIDDAALWVFVEARPELRGDQV